MDVVYLTPEELSARYRGEISTRTLANWRSKGEGPRFRKIGGKVLYALSDVVEWENGRARTTSSRLVASIIATAVRPMVGWWFSLAFGIGAIAT